MKKNLVSISVWADDSGEANLAVHFENKYQNQARYGISHKKAIDIQTGLYRSNKYNIRPFLVGIGNVFETKI